MDIHALLRRVGKTLSAQGVIIRVVETGRLVGCDGDDVGCRVATLFPCVAVGSEVSANVVAEIWWLVVANVLVEYAHVIGVVGHEPRELMLRRVPCGEDFQVNELRLVGHDEFLAPVAYQVAIPAGIRLRAVDERLVKAIDGESASSIAVVADGVLVDELSSERTIEPNGCIARGWLVA